MCGRFSQFTDYRVLGKRFAATPPKKNYGKRYNIAPLQPVPAILNTDPDSIQYIMWGITTAYGKRFLINARDDSLLKFTWRKALEERRCLILADGFYEWQRLTKKEKVPYRFQLKNGEPFAFAGLWQYEKDNKGNEVPHCVIITTNPNKTTKKVHNRMPAILSPDDEKEWLNPDIDTEHALKLIRPYPDSEMEAFPISPKVNIPSNDTEDIIRPAENSL